jgi:D-cysteine desulfhydrase
LTSALLARFPALRDQLPRIPLATVPTPVEELTAPEGFRGRLFVKRDDLISPRYGGNKIRKFELLLGQAERQGARCLVSLGGIGSHQALGLALHGRALGLAVDVPLVPQPVTPDVTATLRGLAAAGATVRIVRTALGGLWSAGRALRRRRHAGERPYYVPPGATTPLSTLGHVAAGLELADQVRLGLLPPPERVFIAAGSCGSAAGLVVGCRLAELPTRVGAVRAYSAWWANRRTIAQLARRAVALLRSLDRSVPPLSVTAADFDVWTEFLGAGYGSPTPAAQAAIAWAAPRLTLETTYTGKALAACLAHGAVTAEGPVLFWNTFNSAPFAQAKTAARS